MKLEDKQGIIDMLVKRIREADKLGYYSAEHNEAFARLVMALMEVIKYKTPEERF